MARKVTQAANKVTVLTDMKLADHTELDKYFQTIYSPDTTFAAWRRLITERKIKIKCPIVALCVGNTLLPLPEHESPAAQLKKLVLAIWETYGKKPEKGGGDDNNPKTQQGSRAGTAH